MFSRRMMMAAYPAVGLIILATSFAGYTLLQKRSGIPASINAGNITSIEGMPLDSEDDLEFFLSRKNIGDRLSLKLRQGIETRGLDAVLVPYYADRPFPNIYLMIGVLGWGLGLAVFLLRRDDVKARLLYLLTLTFSSSLIISGGFHCLRQAWWSFLPGILFYIAYPLLPALFLHFSLSFSRERFNRRIYLLYMPAFIFVCGLEVFFLRAGMTFSLDAFRSYQLIFRLFRFYLFSYALGSVFVLIRSLRQAVLDERKAQLKWILYGLAVGLAPFFFTYQLPRALRIHPLLSEEISSVFFILIPLAFAGAIIRHKWLNIEFLINRSLVYAVLTVFIVSIYLLTVQLVHSLVPHVLAVNDAVISVSAALAAALVFHPARKRIQDLVDRTFFRQSYDHKECLMEFMEEVQDLYRQDELIEKFRICLMDVLPVESLNVPIFSDIANNSDPSFVQPSPPSLDFHVGRLKSQSVYAVRDALRTREEVDFSLERTLKARGISLVIPLSFQKEHAYGYVVLGDKKNGEKYTLEDIELLLALTSELSVHLERIRLQEEVFLERASREKLEEINRLKTEFITSVSHELRTPMSSISGLTELLSGEAVKGKAKREEMFGLLVKETQRLSRFLHNILDFGKIEQQVKTYRFKRGDLRPVVRDVVATLNVGRDGTGRPINIHLPDYPVEAVFDEDAVKQALINLIDNAVKYTPENKEVEVALDKRNGRMEIRVKDEGIGVPPDDRERIFEGFNRTREAVKRNPGGVGLGLKIVRHIMDAHGGSVKVESRPGLGSTFALVFPES